MGYDATIQVAMIMTIIFFQVLEIPFESYTILLDISIADYKRKENNK